MRVEPRASPSPPERGNDIDENEDGAENADVVEIPFKPVTLTFTDICYDVKASKGKDTIRLLNNVNGIFQAGRMCALMGSSGVSLSNYCRQRQIRLLFPLMNFCDVSPGWENYSHGACSSHCEL